MTTIEKHEARIAELREHIAGLDPDDVGGQIAASAHRLEIAWRQAEIAKLERAGDCAFEIGTVVVVRGATVGDRLLTGVVVEAPRRYTARVRLDEGLEWFGKTELEFYLEALEEL